MPDLAILKLGKSLASLSLSISKTILSKALVFHFEASLTLITVSFAEQSLANSVELLFTTFILAGII